MVMSYLMKKVNKTISIHDYACIFDLQDSSSPNVLINVAGFDEVLFSSKKNVAHYFFGKIM